MTQERHDWAESLDGLLEQAWKRFGRGVADRRAAARHPTLATIDANGWPQVRTVVLRGADRAASQLRVYTDRKAGKVAELAAAPRASLHVWDQTAHLQIRVMAEAVVHTGTAVESIWSGLSAHAQRCYGFQPASGLAITDALDYAVWPQPEDFAVIELNVVYLEALHLGHRHRRAGFDRSQDWAAQWLVP
ncbi:pyridoxamine 5'-phosphate oxidase [Spiribacter aquaticus]|uniref:Pyridoxamine 5'-phosphate oxidase n=1 Tax=Spiribacter aquaticus TaxID=1935996 RepID=A0A557RJP2_9GAMM|nr:MULTISPECIES: pyridoxamine 5'-phosphate oxidase family protein [Spiribacter]KAF0280096.1 pyridoxamine 5'-phosphate oxidase [Spiribacter roseus]TVO65375.1 pyridoxamine 5'-phosphate oxidase [Spiribacter aquaticus]